MARPKPQPLTDAEQIAQGLETLGRLFAEASAEYVRKNPEEFGLERPKPAEVVR